MDQLYPGYGFKKHKGYPTKFHLDALKSLGPCKIHRLSFRPVKKLINRVSLSRARKTIREQLTKQHNYGVS